MNINQLVVSGRVTKDLSVGYTSGGVARVSFSVAHNRYYKKGEEWISEPSFFEVEAWGKIAERLNGSVHKGDEVLVTGRLKQERWTTQDGSTRSTVKIAADNICKTDNARGGERVSEANASTGVGNNDRFPEDVPF